MKIPAIDMKIPEDKPLNNKNNIKEDKIIEEKLTINVEDLKVNLKTLLSIIEKMTKICEGIFEQRKSEPIDGFIGNDIIEILYNYCAKLNFKCYINCGNYAYSKLLEICKTINENGRTKLNIYGEYIEICKYTLPVKLIGIYEKDNGLKYRLTLV